jgi:hypothetical protein
MATCRTEWIRIMSLRNTLGAVALASAFAAPAFAVVDGSSAIGCADSFMSFTNGGYVSCRGPLAGDLATLGSVSFADVGSLRFAGLAGDGSGAFTAHPGASVLGLLQFGQAQHGNFVIGLQGGGGYSLYLFNGGEAGIGSIAYDTFGIVNRAGLAGPSLTDAALFAGVVPEPTRLALLLAGLATLGFVARRRAF